MRDAALPVLATWENFYVIVGSSAAALTGLMFVVITLISGTRDPRSGDAIAAYSTPTVVHFCAALTIAAILSAPWQALWQTGLLLGLSGLSGVLYISIVVRRVRRQAGYTPVLEDWLSHVILPLLSYVALIVSGLLLPHNPQPTLFLTAAVSVILVFIGIHNAWDTVTFLIVEQPQPGRES